MKKLLNNKFLILIFCFLLFVFLNFNKSQAHIEKYDTINETFGDNAWVLYKGEDENIYIAVGNYYADSVYANYNNAYVHLFENKYLRFSSTSTGIEHYFGVTVYSVDESYNFTQKCKYIWDPHNYSSFTAFTEIIDVHLTHNITNENGGATSYVLSNFEGDITDPFWVAPQATLGLVEILEQEKEQVATMKEILEILPLIIVILASFLGLRKALRMLVSFLKTS